MLGDQGIDGTGPSAETVQTTNVSSPAAAEAPPQSIYAWGKTVKSDEVDEILAGFNIQKILRENDKEKTNKTCSEYGSLKNDVQLSTGTILLYTMLDGTKLGWIAGMGTYSGGLTSTSAYKNCDMGLISDRTRFSEPVAAKVKPEFWGYHIVPGVSSSGTGLAAFYAKAENRTKFYDGEDDKKQYTWMPAFLILPQELVAWFLENEPTAYELYEKLHRLSTDGDVHNKLKLALEWCVCACHDDKNNPLRQKVETVLFSRKETPCANWFDQRVIALIGEGRKGGQAQQAASPTTQSQPPPAPIATPSPQKPKTFLDLTETGK